MGSWLRALLVLFFVQRSSASSKLLSTSAARTYGLRGGTTAHKANHAPLWNLSEPNFNVYHRSDVLLKQVQALVERHPKIMSIEVLEGERDGYSTEITVVTVEPGGKGIKQDEKMRLLLDFGQHGRELVTSEVGYRLLQTLGGEHPLGEIDNDALYRILPHTILKIVPMENPNGRRKVEAGQLCERKNGRGVDINRNWGVDWGKKEKDYDPAEEYPGPSAFSEPETLLVRDLAMSFKPHVWVNVHSGMEALFMPYDHRSSTPTDGAGPMKALLQTVNRLHCMDNCVVGSGGGSVGYLAHGTATDYMYDVLKIPVAFTWEIYGDLMQPEDECFQMFNPATPQRLEEVVSRWSDAFFTLLVNLPKTLRRLPTRAPMLPVWNWDSFPISATDQILDTELRNRFPGNAFTDEASKDEWGGDVRSDAGLNGEEKLLLEVSLLFAGVVLTWIFIRICKCDWWKGSPFPHSSLGDRGKRIPV